MSLRNDSQNAASIEYSFHKWSIKVLRYGSIRAMDLWPTSKIFHDPKYNSSDIKFIKKIIIPSLLRVHLFLLLLFHYYAEVEWKLTNFCSFLKITTPKINSRNSTSDDIHIISSYNMKYLVHDREPVKPIARICADTCSATSRNEWF